METGSSLYDAPFEEPLRQRLPHLLQCVDASHD